MKFPLLSGFSAILLIGIFVPSVQAQSTENSSSLTNSAAPAAASTVSGGTNINYQTNNSFNNENGFGPGIFCRTPTFRLGGNWGQANLNAYDPIQESGNQNRNFSVNADVVVPFGSSVLADCKKMVAALARDREISSQLSMLRTCAKLKKEGLVVNPDKFPMLSPCVEDKIAIKQPVLTSQPRRIPTSISPRINNSVPPNLNLKPKTNRVL